jgi:3-deoxy-7-phosphoheptulonate synthase
MLITLHPDADVGRVRKELAGLGQWIEDLSTEGGRRAMLLRPHSAALSLQEVRAIEGVADVFVARSGHPLLDELEGCTVDAGGVPIGDGAEAVLIAGPCSIESETQVDLAARMVAEAGGKLLRGGAYKPRTSPYSFLGHGAEALGWMRRAADAHGLSVITEVLSERDVDTVARHADVLQVGARNMQNYALLRAVGAVAYPVLLKRSMSASLEEWFLAAEHLLNAGASGVVLCERGIVGFDPSTRNLLDLGAVALIAHVHRLPVVVDPSHAVGRRDLIEPLCRAALAAGAHGVMVEAHPDARQALSDGPQALEPAALRRLGWAGRAAVREAVG